VLTVSVLDPPVPETFAGMTFPAYRHLLALRPVVRLLSDPGHPPVQPVAVGGWSGGVPVGLALADVPVDGPTDPELLSVFVTPAQRGNGIGRRLLQALEKEITERGFDTLSGTYTAGRPATHAVKRMLAACGWSEPGMRTLSVDLTVEQAQSLPWLQRVPVRSGCEIVPWIDITPEEKAALKRSQEESGWIAPDLVPWRHEVSGFEEVTSVGLRGPDGVVGWVINHEVPPETVRFTCSYIRKDFGRRARILPLYRASIERLSMTVCSRVTFVAPTRHPTMVSFVRRRIEPYASSVRETYGSAKALSGSKSSAVSVGSRAEPNGSSISEVVERSEPIEPGTRDPQFETERGAS
jgi:GNAT superfamily N-acetyltransferase